MTIELIKLYKIGQNLTTTLVFCLLRRIFIIILLQSQADKLDRQVLVGRSGNKGSTDTSVLYSLDYDLILLTIFVHIISL